MYQYKSHFKRNLLIIGFLYLISITLALGFQPAGAAATGVGVEGGILELERCPNFDLVRELSFWDSKSGFAYESVFFGALTELFKTIDNEDFNYHAYDTQPRGTLSPVWTIYLDNDYSRDTRYYIIVYRGLEHDKIYPAVWSYTRLFGDESGLLDANGLRMSNHPDCGWFSVDTAFMSDAMLLIHQEMMKQQGLGKVVGLG